MALVRTISAETAAGYGVNILEDSPAAVVQGRGTRIVAIVGDFPWGPTDEPTLVGSGAELIEQFCPAEFQAANDYLSMRAVMGLQFPSSLVVVRIAATSAATAAKTFPHTGATDAVDVTARYEGVLGNRIRISFADNATVPEDSDMTVKVLGSDGTTVRYSRTYLRAIVDGGAALSVSAEAAADPFVVTAIAAGAPDTAPDAVADSALDDVAGADGTGVAGDWSDALATLGDSSVTWNVGFGAEVPSAMVDTWNDAVTAFADAQSGNRFLVHSTPASEDVATALTNVDSAQQSDRCLRPWRRVRVTNEYDPLRGLVTVDGNADAAVAIASVDPWLSPGGAGGNKHMRRIKGVEAGVTATDAQLESLTDAGLTPIVISSALGPILRNARTTSLESADSRRVKVRRLTDYIVTAISDTLVQYAERPLDVDIVNRRLGPVTLPEIGSIRTFLDQLVGPALRSYQLDPFGGNVQANIDSGQWFIILRAKYLPAQEQIILRIQAGAHVSIEEG